MKGFLTTLALAVLGLGSAAQAQSSFTYTTPVGTMINNGDTLTFTVPNAPVGAYAPANIRVYTNIDNGDPTEIFDVYDENWTNVFTSTSVGSDCMDSEFDFTASAGDVNAWAADGTMTFYTVPAFDIDMFCNNTIYIEISYDTCAFGTPVQFAAISSADSSVCPAGGNVQLSGTPTGGTFSGIGVSGNQFNPAGFAPGIYTVTYTATDAIGCVTSADLDITVEVAPVAPYMLVCPGNTATIAPVGSNFAWFADANLTVGLDTAATYTTPALFQTTNYYIQRVVQGNIFEITSMTNSNTAQVDHNSLSGDDRAGIAVSDSFVFVVGDNFTTRYAHDFTGGLNLPIRDGIFSNVANNSLWSLYNGTAAPAGTYVSSYSVSQLVGLDNSLNFTATTLTLSSAITLNCANNDCGVFAGAGYLGLYSNDDDTWYVVDLANGNVTNLGSSSGNTTLYNTENWAAWGALEFDGTDFYATYHNGNTGNIARQSLPNGTLTDVVISGNLGDMSSLVVMPSMNRWYGHCEGCAFFGAGGSEILGYADATTFRANVATAQTVGCANVATVEVPEIDLGADVTACQGSLHTIFAGMGYTSYTWNGVNNNFNAYTVNASGTYDVAVEDMNGCTLRDTITVTFNVCSGVTENQVASFNIYPNPTSGDFVIATSDFASEGELRLEAYDMTGRMVKFENFGVVAGQLQRTVAMQGMPAGVYTLRLSDSKQSQSFKLVITE